MSHQVFISHSSEDHVVAHKVYEFLKSEGLSCFMDDFDLGGGDVFVEVIPEAIRKSTVIVLILSSNSDTSPDVLKELELARTEEKRIVPFRVEKLRPHGLAWILAGITWIDAFQPPLEDPLRILVERIRAILGVPKPLEQSSGPKSKTGPMVSPPKQPPVRPGEWCEIDYKDLNDWVKERIKVLNSGKQLVARTFVYRKDRYTGKYERKLKTPVGERKA